MAVCCDDNDRTLVHAYTSSTSSGVRVNEGLLDSDGDDAVAVVVVVVAVVDGGDDSGGDSSNDVVTTSSLAAVVVFVAVVGDVTPRTTVSNRLNSNFPPDSLSRALITSCQDEHRKIRLVITCIYSQAITGLRQEEKGYLSESLGVLVIVLHRLSGPHTQYIPFAGNI